MTPALAILLAVQASVGGLPAAQHPDCASLTSLQLLDVKITNAAPVAAGVAAAVRGAHEEKNFTCSRVP